MLLKIWFVAMDDFTIECIHSHPTWSQHNLFIPSICLIYFCTPISPQSWDWPGLRDLIVQGAGDLHVSRSWGRMALCVHCQDWRPVLNPGSWEAWFPKAGWASSIWGWRLRLSWLMSDQFYPHCQFTLHFYSCLYLLSPGYLLSLFKIHMSATNWHLPRAFASNWATTRAFAICLWGNQTLGCCSCWPSTPTEGNSG